MLTSEQQSQRLSLALKGAKCGLWDWNIADNTIYFDPNYFLISGYEPDEFPHHLDEWKKRVHPDDLALVERTTQQYLSGEIKAFAIEFRFKTKTGDWMWILGQGEISERDKDGNPVRFLGLHIDISQQKLAEKLLRKERDFSKSLVDTAQAIVLVLDMEGRILTFNPHMEEITGYKLAEVKGKDWFSTFLPEEDYSNVHTVFREAVGDIQTKGQVNPILTKDGRKLQVEWNDKTLKDSEENIVGLLCIGQDITDRKQNENKLLESETRYRSLFQNNHSVMLLVDPRTAAIVDTNPAACHYYGYDKDTLLRMKISDINQLTEQQVFAEMASARKEQRNYFNFQHRLASGDIRDVEVYSGPIRIQGKDLLYSIINDITESKRTKKALQDSEAKLDSILRSAPIGIGQVTNREINFVNENFAQMLGYSVQELIGKKSRIVYHSDEEFERVGQYKYEEIKKKGTGSIDTVLQKKDGTLIDVFLSSTPVNPDDLSQGVTFTALDITERKEAEAVLSNAAYEWRLIMDEFEDAIYLLDNDRRLLRGNTAFYKIIETTPERAIGCHISELIHPQCEGACPVCLAQEEKRDFIMVMEADDENNSTGRPIEIKVKIVRDEKGASTGILMNLHDLTQTRLNEEQRHELEKQLRQKHKMEAVGYMAGGMAHNFNNNLSIILGNVELSLMKQPVGSDVSPLLENAKIAVRRSRDLILKIITYSRKGSQQKAPMQLTTIIDETITLMQATLPSTVNLQKSYSPECDSIYIDADASQIQEVLINLCNNAIQAMDEKGELKIHREPVELTQQEIPAQYDCLPGRYAKLSVQDSGCGMPAEMLDKIFDPFYTTKEEYEGAGMGLATVQGIVAQHGGIIKVSSTPGQGTTFNLYFPIIEQTHREGSIAENTTLPRGTERILFVDDDEMLARLGKELLTEMGYQVSVMTESTEALKMFTANADYFDLVITDQTMPDLCGEDLIHELKKVRPDIPTILCTGYSSRIDEERARELGISAFLMKPLDLPKLAQTVRNVLDGVEIE